MIMANLFSASNQSAPLEVNHECEYFPNGLESVRLESGDRWKQCKKYDDHDKHYFPANDIIDRSSSLNEDQRRLLREFSNRVVGILVEWTSELRPSDYPWADKRGTRELRFGTGFVYYVSKRKEGQPCPCEDCRGKVTTHWTFFVRTAFHVVFNSDEAKETRIDLFYDEKGFGDDSRTVWAVSMEESESSKDTDQSILLCVTHEEQVAQKLTSSGSFWPTLVDRSLIYYPENRGLVHALGLEDAIKGFDHAVIFSHPHGEPKKISVGRLVEHNDHSTFNLPPGIKYRTPTCPGCSGAPVILIKAQSDFLDPKRFPWNGPVHRASRGSTSPINYSQSGSYQYPAV
ncbi:hypothetical protein EGW08_017048 [Elysia chlorotica]|uniref:Uncharacterized protein n=1 Tax=Elysia chlorotica TaxID=188477 RepID=A0A433T0X7_ELYCH|nr:hypothetical protein EGW08_017048 [Elysia chlorotica]